MKAGSNFAILFWSIPAGASSLLQAFRVQQKAIEISSQCASAFEHVSQDHV